MTSNRPVIIWEPLTGHPDQRWCAYELDANGALVPNGSDDWY